MDLGEHRRMSPEIQEYNREAAGYCSSSRRGCIYAGEQRPMPTGCPCARHLNTSRQISTGRRRWRDSETPTAHRPPLWDRRTLEVCGVSLKPSGSLCIVTAVGGQTRMVGYLCVCIYAVVAKRIGAADLISLRSDAAS